MGRNPNKRKDKNLSHKIVTLGKSVKPRKLTLKFLSVLVCVCCLVVAFTSAYSQDYDKETIYQVQKRLKELGYEPGQIDGFWGRRTESALKKFQNDNSLSVTGRIDSAAKTKLGLIAAESKVLKTTMPAGRSFDLVLIGSLLTMALYHFCLFGFGRKEITTLYFGCLCVLTAFLYMMYAERFFIALFPNFDLKLAVKIEYISVYLGFTIFVMFIKNLYPHEFSQKMLRVSQSLGVLFILLTLVTNPEIHQDVIKAYGATALILSIYLVYVLTRAGLRNRDGAICFLGVLSLLFAIIINDIYLQSIIYPSQLLPWGVFIFIFAQSVVLSLRFSKSSDREVVYERFVPKEFLKNLHKEDIVDVKLGDNAEIDMSVLFSDIRDFTTLSEVMTPEENFKFINSYLTVMGPVIRRYHGFIDKYIGDAIMALFDKSADDALRGAIGMLRELDKYNEGRKRAGYANIQIGIGINTGMLRIGTIGESGRMEGTVISDTVNVASRIEGMTKKYGVSLLISDQTFRSLEDPSKYHIREIDRVKVKGKTEPITMWEVFDGDPPDILSYKLDIATTFEEARYLYHSKRFGEALELLMDCLVRNPRDKTAALYIDRCKLYMEMGADENGEGIVRRVAYTRG